MPTGTDSLAEFIYYFIYFISVNIQSLNYFSVRRILFFQLSKSLLELLGIWLPFSPKIHFEPPISKSIYHIIFLFSINIKNCQCVRPHWHSCGTNAFTFFTHPHNSNHPRPYSLLQIAKNHTLHFEQVLFLLQTNHSFPFLVLSRYLFLLKC